MRKGNAGQDRILHPANQRIVVDFKKEGVLKIAHYIDR